MREELSVEHKRPPDHGLIEPIAVPAGHRMPDPATGVASSAEYDRYFRLDRAAIDLAEWTRTCLTVNRELVRDLDDTTLDEDDKRAILLGLVTVAEVTLNRWLRTVAPQEPPVDG